MKLNFDLKAFKVGMRTFKTMIAVGLTITLFELLHRQPAVLAAIAAVFTLSMRPPLSLAVSAFLVILSELLLLSY